MKTTFFTLILLVFAQFMISCAAIDPENSSKTMDAVEDTLDNTSDIDPNLEHPLIELPEANSVAYSLIYDPYTPGVITGVNLMINYPQDALQDVKLFEFRYQRISDDDHSEFRSLTTQTNATHVVWDSVLPSFGTFEVKVMALSFEGNFFEVGVLHITF